MSLLITSNKSQSGEYNFSTDPNAGATGTINLGVWLPTNAIVSRFFVKTITTANSGGAATLSFRLNSTVLLLGVTPFGAFTAGNCIAGVDFNANPIVASSALTPSPQVQLLIAGAALTAGRFAFFIEYFESNV